MSYDRRNRYFIELNNLCLRKQNCKSGLFNNASTKVLMKLFIDNIDKIISDDKINFEELISPEQEEWLLKFIKSGNLSMFIDNSRRLKRQYEEQLIEVLKNIREEDFQTISSKEMLLKRDDFYDVEQHEGSDKFYPLKSFTFTSFMKNVFVDRNIKYKFTEKAPSSVINGQSIRTNTLVTQKIEIVSFLSTRELITRKTWTCTHNEMTDSGSSECGRKIFFSPIDECNKIDCHHGAKKKLPDKGHTLAKKEAIVIDETTNMYMYSVKLIGDAKEQEYIVECPFEIEKKIVEANMIFAGLKDEKINLIVAVNHKSHELPFEGKFFARDEKNFSCLHDVFESIKKYLSDYHKIDVTNKGKLIAEVICLQLILQLYYDYHTKAMVFGSSGAGKSYWSSLISPLFTNSFVTFFGGDVTRNRLLGGKPADSELAKVGKFLPGAIATHNYVIIEEMTDVIDSLYYSAVNHKDISNNVFSMLKVANYKGQPYEIAIQGGQKALLRASILLIGNLEQLAGVRKQYTSNLRMKYKIFGGTKRFQKSWPLYKPVEYYKLIMKNEALAKAHQQVREEMYPTHHITFLSDAEQSRFAFFLTLEEDTVGYPDIYSNTSMLFQTVHSEQIAKELNEIITVKSIHDIRKSKLESSVKEFMREYIRGRNNYITQKTKHRTQLMTVISDTFTRLIMFQRQYMDKKTTKEEVVETSLTDDEKALIEYYSQYNYNTLTETEVALTTKPFFNDLVINSNELYNEEAENKEKIKEQERKEKEAKEPLKLNMTEEDPFGDE